MKKTFFCFAQGCPLEYTVQWNDIHTKSHYNCTIAVPAVPSEGLTPLKPGLGCRPSSPIQFQVGSD